MTTDECSWHEDAYGFKRIYAMGCYIKRETLAERGVEDLLSNHILGLKLYPNYSNPLGQGLALCVKERYSELLRSDFIVPVPRVKSELKIARDPKGLRYNQTFELAKVMSSILDIPTAELLVKTRPQSMTGLNRTERLSAVEGLYAFAGGHSIRNTNALIVDDVSTSNATASECAKVLLDNGTEEVNVLVAGRDTDVMVERGH